MESNERDGLIGRGHLKIRKNLVPGKHTGFFKNDPS